jgi:tetratricopeptide (TPR) repeat protein
VTASAVTLWRSANSARQASEQHASSEQQTRDDARRGRLALANRLVLSAEQLKPYAGARTPVVESLLLEGQTALDELQADDEDWQVLEALARLNVAFANLNHRLNQSGQALKRTFDAEALCRRLLTHRPQSRGLGDLLALCQERRGQVQWARGRISDAAQAYQEALAWWDSVTADPGDTTVAVRQASCSLEIGRVLLARDDLGGAYRSLETALKLRAHAAQARPDDMHLRIDHAQALRSWSELVLSALGPTEAARDKLQQAIEILEDLQRRHLLDEDGQREYVETLASYADWCAALGQSAQADAGYRTALGVAQAAARLLPRDAWWQRQVLTVRFRHAQMLSDWSDLDERLVASADVARELDRILEELGQGDPENVIWPDLRAGNLMALGLIDAVHDAFQNAKVSETKGIISLRRALDIAVPLTKADSTHCIRHRRIPLIHQLLAVAHGAAGRVEEREHHLGQANHQERMRNNSKAPVGATIVGQPVQPKAITVFTAALRVLQVLDHNELTTSRARIAVLERDFAKTLAPQPATAAAQAYRNAIRLLKQLDVPEARYAACKMGQCGERLLLQVDEAHGLTDEQRRLLNELRCRD